MSQRGEASNSNKRMADAERPTGDARAGGEWAGRTVALCVTGSIAAYKAAELARLFVKAGARVLPVMTASAARFVGPVTLAGLCGEPVVTDMWDASFAGEMHVKIAEQADLVAIVPATADMLSRLAHGRADDLVTALALGARGPVLAAPAMHPRMWDHPATRRNVADLATQGRVTLVGPVRGEVASGDDGTGRMAEPADILAAASALLGSVAPRGAREVAQDLAGLKVVVTAGPTLEDIDPVRFLGNRSTGKMGFAVAEQAAARGAEVTLVAGPVQLSTPQGVRRVDIRSALEMREALWRALGPDLSGADALVMAAAVADHRPAQIAPHKIKKGDASGSIELVKNPDLLGEVGAARHGAGAPSGGPRRQASGPASRPVLVGFAVETAGGEALVAYARRKLEEKRVDLVVANEAADSFGREDNRVVLVTAAGAETLPKASKSSLATAILDRVRGLL
jgi:phosphopantothenoylcysteine decarboxylase/phosphopantothenate--cysteine ligase